MRSSRAQRDEMGNRVVEIDGDNTVITQRLIGGKTESIHRMDDTMSLAKFGKNRVERRKTDPPSTNSLEMILGKVRLTHERLDVVPNKCPKMRSDTNQRNPLNRRNRPVKLEIAANNYTKSSRCPDETRTTIKSALIFSKKVMLLFLHYSNRKSIM